MYVKFYALTDEECRFFRLLRLRALVATAALGAVLLVATLLFGMPHGLELTGWPFSPVDWYGWALALWLVFTAFPAMALMFAVMRLYINSKVRRNSPGISGVAFPMAVVILGLVLFALVLAGKLAYTAAWMVPTAGWPSGMVWAHWVKDKIVQVGFSPEGQLIHVKLKSGEFRSWLLGRAKETAASTGPVAMGPVSTTPNAAAEAVSMTIGAGGTVLEFKRDSNKIKVLEGPGDKDRLLTGAAVLGVALSEDGLLALSASVDGVVRMWDLEKPTTSGRPVGSHEGQAFAVACSRDKKIVISGGQDTKARVWNLATKKQIAVLAGGHKTPVRHVALNADGKRAVSASEDGANAVLCVWDVEGGKLLGQYEWRASATETIHLSMSPDGRYALTTDGESVQAWRLP